MPDLQNNSPQTAPFEMVTNSKPKKMSPKNIFIIAIALLFLGISVFLGVYLVGQQTNVEEKAAPATSMYISPDTQTKNSGDNFTFTVEMDTGVNAVTGVDVRLIFDPSVIQVLSLQQGSGITDLDQTVSDTYDNLAGTASYAVYTLNGSNAVTGSGIEVLRVNATVRGSAIAGNYDISFDPGTAASASQEGQNVLVSKSKATIVVGASIEASASPTVSPTAPGNPLPTGSPNPTATGSANSCGGTCGSNNNCQSNYMCYQGVCRNPNCPTNSACGCATASPSPTTAVTSVTRTPQSSPLAIPVSGTEWPTLLGVGVGLFVVIASIALAI